MKVFLVSSFVYVDTGKISNPCFNPSMFGDLYLDPNIKEEFREKTGPLPHLPKSCETLLNKGLNFVPTPTTVNTTLIEVNIKRFNRMIIWMEYFHSNSSDENCTLFTLFVDFVLLFVCFV